MISIFNNKNEETLLENLYKNLDNTYNKFSHLFDELMSMEKVTYNKKSILRKEMIEVCKDLYIYLSSDLEKVITKINNKNNRRKSLGIATLLNILLKILGLSFLFINPLITILVNLFSLSIDMYLFNPKRLKEIEINYDKLIEKIQKVNIIMYNCSTRLSLDFDLTTSEYSNEDFLDIELASDIIINYINNKEIKVETEEVKTFIIKMLQQDLKSDSTDLIELLNLAREKNNEETLIKQKNLTNKEV